MSHEGVSGYGTFEREWAKFQKRGASTAELVERALAVAEDKATAPAIVSAGWPDWSKVIKAGNIETGVKGRDLGPTRFGENLPFVGGLFKSFNTTIEGAGAGAVSAGKWIVVALVAVAALVVIPRLIPR